MKDKHMALVRFLSYLAPFWSLWNSPWGTQHPRVPGIETVLTNASLLQSTRKITMEKMENTHLNSLEDPEIWGADCFCVPTVADLYVLG